MNQINWHLVMGSIAFVLLVDRSTELISRDYWAWVLLFLIRSCIVAFIAHMVYYAVIAAIKNIGS